MMTGFLLGANLGKRGFGPVFFCWFIVCQKSGSVHPKRYITQPITQARAKPIGVLCSIAKRSISCFILYFPAFVFYFIAFQA